MDVHRGFDSYPEIIKCPPAGCWLDTFRWQQRVSHHLWTFMWKEFGKSFYLGLEIWCWFMALRCVLTGFTSVFLSYRKKYVYFLFFLLAIRINIYGSHYPFNIVRRVDQKYYNWLGFSAITLASMQIQSPSFFFLLFCTVWPSCNISLHLYSVQLPFANI